MAEFNKETTVGRMAADIYEKRQQVIDTMRVSLANDFASYCRKYGDFPVIESDQDIMKFIIGRPELRQAFSSLDINQEATVKLFKEAMALAEEKLGK